MANVNLRLWINSIKATFFVSNFSQVQLSWQLLLTEHHLPPSVFWQKLFQNENQKPWAGNTNIVAL